jgi:ubiquinone/menaquinone biosynthesis C-methylase UbiE
MQIPFRVQPARVKFVSATGKPLPKITISTSSRACKSEMKNRKITFMNQEKELAYRYDLLISPIWRERFDALIDRHIQLPAEGRVLDVNCGTGAFTLELANRLGGRGEVIGVDPDAERLELARAKALITKQDNVTFEQGEAFDLRFSDKDFDAVIGDVSMLPAQQLEKIFAEMIRVASYDAPVVLKLATHGSFDEFFSIFWEALLHAELADPLLGQLEGLINERLTVTAAEGLAKRLKLRQVASFVSREDFDFETAEAFLESPLIKDLFLDAWLAIVPESKRRQVADEMVSIIDRERGGGSFDISIKATLIKGVK